MSDLVGNPNYRFSYAKDQLASFRVPDYLHGGEVKLHANQRKNCSPLIL